jgi:hypothetical protein
VENWKGTTLSFILHYQEQIRLYDQLQPPNEQTSDHAKMIYLQNAVYAIEELRLVQTTGSQIALANGTVPTYKDYKALLKSAASTYDRAHTPVKHQPTRSAKHTCMMTTSLACNWAIESSYWRMDNNSDVGLLMGYVLYQILIELGSMDLDTFSHWFGLHPSLLTSW